MSSLRNKLADKTTKLDMPRQNFEDHPANMTYYEDGSFCNIELDLVHENPHQPRQFFDEEALMGLAESIRDKGVIQPIVIRKDEDNNILLVAGERRCRAARMAGLEKIPAILTKGDPIEISLIENLQRENLKPIEEAEALARMRDEHGYTQEKLALIVGKGRSTVTEILSINKLTNEIKEECRRTDIPKRVLIEIAKKDSPEEMNHLFNQVKDGALTSDQVRNDTRNKNRPERKHQSRSRRALDKVLNLSKSLQKLNFYGEDETEKLQLITELQKLRKLISRVIR